MKNTKCKLCGGKATIENEDSKRHVECANCGSFTEAAWNEINKLKNTIDKFEWDGYIKVEWPQSQDYMDDEDAYLADNGDGDSGECTYFVPYLNYINSENENIH